MTKKMLIALSVLSSVLTIVPAVLYGKIIDTAILSRNVTLLFELCSAAFGVEILLIGIDLFKGLVDNKISLGLSGKMRSQLFERYVKMSPELFTPEQDCKVQESIYNDVEKAILKLTFSVPNFVSDVSLIAATVGTLFLINWKLALLGMASIPLMAIPVKISEKGNKLYVKQNQVQADLDQAVSKLNAAGIKEIQQNGQQEAVIAEFNENIKLFNEICRKKFYVNRGSRIIMQLLEKAGPFMITLVGGFLFINSGDATISLGTMIASILLIKNIQGRIVNVYLRCKDSVRKSNAS